jgi:glycosyl transferase family 87
MPERHLLQRLPHALRVAAIAAGLLAGLHFVDRLAGPRIYRDDFVQDYLLARAVLDGQDPYALTGSVLAERYLSESEPETIHHVSLHPPAAALMSLPLGMLSYRSARSVWLLFEVGLLFLLVCLLPGRRAAERWFARLGITAMLLAWPPVAMDLQCGQWSILLAAVLALSWECYRTDRPRAAGSLLGLAIAIKLFPVLMLFLFGLKRAWRVVGYGIGSAAALTAVAALVIGPGALAGYLASGARTTTGWFTCFANYSVLGSAARLFTSAGGFGSVPPFVSLPVLVGPVVAVTAAVLLAIVARDILASSEDGPFAVALCGLVLATPLVWQHFLVLLLWPLWLAGSALAATGWPRPRSDAFLLAAVLVTLPQQAVSLLAILASGVWPPAGAVILLALPAGPVLLLGFLRMRPAAALIPTAVVPAPASDQAFP